MIRLAAVLRSRVPRLALACGVAALVAAGPAVAGPASAAPAGAAGARRRGGAAVPARRRPPPGRPRRAAPPGPPGAVPAAALDTAPAEQVTIAISSVSPQIARPGKSVTVSGTVTNGTKNPVSGLAVQLWSSTVPLGSRSELASYAAGQLLVDHPLPVITPLAGTVGAGATRSWTLTAPAASLGHDQLRRLSAGGPGIGERDTAQCRAHVPAVLAGQHQVRPAGPAGADRLDLAADRPAGAGRLPGPARQ